MLLRIVPLTTALQRVYHITKVTQILFDTIGGQLVATGVDMLSNIDGSVSIANASSC